MALAVALAACGEGSPPVGPGSVPDAGLVSDAGFVSVADAGLVPDAGVPDAGAAYLPSNAAQFGTFASNGIRATASGQFNTDTQCTAGAVLGECQHAPDDACVCRSEQLSLGDLRVVGSRARVLLVRRMASVSGVVSVSAQAGAPGPGARPSGAVSSSNGTGGGGGSFGSMGGFGGARGIAFASSATAGTAALRPLLGG